VKSNNSFKVRKGELIEKEKAAARISLEQLSIAEW
jgi:hypothetical protein